MNELEPSVFLNVATTPEREFCDEVAIDNLVRRVFFALRFPTPSEMTDADLDACVQKWHDIPSNV